jgi:hypothetical protein
VKRSAGAVEIPFNQDAAAVERFVREARRAHRLFLRGAVDGDYHVADRYLAEREVALRRARSRNSMDRTISFT